MRRQKGLVSGDKSGISTEDKSGISDETNLSCKVDEGNYNKNKNNNLIIINEEIRKKINKKEETLKERVEWFHSQMDRDANQAESWLMGLKDITSEEENFKDRYTYWVFGGTL